MPALLAGLIVEGLGLVGAAAVAVTVVVEIAATLAINLALSAIAKALAGKPSAQTTAGIPQSRQITAKGTIEFRQLIYGQVRTGGFLVFFGTSGTNNNFLWFVIAAAGHECAAIDDLWLDGRHVANGDISGSTVTSSTFTDGGGSRLSVWKHLGGATSTVDSNLAAAFPEWDSAHVGVGVAHTIFRLDRSDVVWATGAPASFYQLVKGRKLYDPRLDSTNGGSGSHRYTDPSTWAWSQNWALAVRDYISGGALTYSATTPDKRLTIGEPDARVDDAYLIAAANSSDEAVTVPLAVLAGTTNWGNGSNAVTGNGTLFTSQLTIGNTVIAPNGTAYTVTGIGSDTGFGISGFYGGTSVINQTTHFGTGTSVTELRFTADCQLSCGTSHAENLAALLSGGNGHLSPVAGKYRLFAGIYTTPTVTLTQDDILGAVDVSSHDPADQTWNFVTGTFFDENNGWTQANFPAQQNSTYETDDGRQYPRSIELQATRGNYRAQRLAQVILQQSRNQLTANFSMLSQKAVNIGEWETFQVTLAEYGWSAQTFRCLEWSFLSSGFISIKARSEGTSAYTDLAVGGYVDPATNNPPKFVLCPPDAPVGLTATSLPNKVGLLITPPPYFPAAQSLEIWEYTSNSPFSSATKIAETRSNYFEVAHFDSATRYYWATVKDQSGGRSTNYPSGAGVAGFALQQIYDLINFTNTAVWVHVGTLFLPIAQSASFYWASGVGFNTGINQQSIAEILIRSSNDTTAPNLSGINVINTGNTQTVTQCKAKATGGSTSGSNHSWELYAQIGAFTEGPFEVILSPNGNAAFTFDGSASSDPGAASSTVVVGNITAGLNPVAGSGLDALPDGTTFARALAAGLTSGVTNRNGLTPNAASLLASTTVAGLQQIICPISGTVQDLDVGSVTVACDGSTLGIDVSTYCTAGGGHALLSTGLITIRRDGSDIGTAAFDVANAIATTGINFFSGQVTLTVVDTPSAANHTYTMHLHGFASGTSGTATINATNTVLKVREYFK